jgi:hypothetical protein
MNTNLACALVVCLACLSGPAAAVDGSVRIVDEGKLGLTHRLAAGTDLAAPGYPMSYSKTGDDVCIALGYTVKPDGTTGDFRLLSAWTSDRAQAEKSDRYLDTFAAAAAQAVSRWRFETRSGVASTPVATVATLSFQGSGSTQGLQARCRITDLAAHYQRLQNGRLAVQRIQEDRRDAQTLFNIRLAESIARLRATQPRQTP